MYSSTAWSKVFAVNAGTGARLWSYDPEVPTQRGANACCDVVNRGVAAWQGKVYIGTLDGRLIPPDAATGQPLWSKLTIDPHWRYTITGAPRIVKGKVIIGNGGAEFGVRGYVSAYDAQTRRVSRFAVAVVLNSPDFMRGWNQCQDAHGMLSHTAEFRLGSLRSTYGQRFLLLLYR